MIRSAQLTDAQSILNIYAPYIRDTAISFETEVPSLIEMQGRIVDVQKKFPWLVFELENKIVGYAYAGTFRSRRAYDWSVESSVYIDQEFRGRGIGKALYERLLNILKEQGVVNVIGGLTLPNEGSVALHESFGFSKVAEIKDVGFKFGQWWDVGFWQLQLQKPTTPETLRAPNLR